MIAQIKVGLEPLPATAESAATEAPAAEPATGSFVIKGLVNQEMGFMEADLRALEVLKINAEHPKNGPQDFEGVSLNALLDMAGVKDGAKTLFVTSADGYTTEVALSDVRACADCLLGFTNTAEQFKLVMPKLPAIPGQRKSSASK